MDNLPQHTSGVFLLRPMVGFYSGVDTCGCFEPPTNNTVRQANAVSLNRGALATPACKARSRSDRLILPGVPITQDIERLLSNIPTFIERTNTPLYRQG